MQMLERDAALLQLQQAWARIAAGTGGVGALISGDAGIGKTMLARALVESLPPAATVLRAGCEALYTPRPLGPWVDLAPRFAPSLERALLQAQSPVGLFGELLSHFRDARTPTLLVMEDVHWADTGTLDLLHYLGRRVQELRLMLVLTHRDDGLDTEHPLLRVLGEWPPATLRIALAPLSRQAVGQLARTAHRDAAEVYAATGGNPFYVTELLSAPGGVPPSVRDAVLAELARLPAAARVVAQWVSLFPGYAERALLDAVAASDPTAMQAAVRSGLLVADGATLSFRHEIARNAVYGALPAPQRADWHAKIHAALARAVDDADLARRVHHAEAAGLSAEVAALAPRAAARAASTGAHLEAARLYARALELAADRESTDAAALLEALANEYLLTNRHRDAIAASEQAGAIHAARGDALRVGDNLRVLARLHWFDAGARGPSLGLAQRAIDTLEQQPPSRELALAYSTMSHLRLVSENMQAAQLWGLRAIELAEAIDDPEALCHALNNVGCARLRLRDDALAWSRLARSLELALQHSLATDAARAYNNLFILSVVHHNFERGLRHAEQGIAFCETQGLDLFNVRIRIRRAFARIVMGQWELADADLAEIAARHSPSPMEAATRDFVAALLGLRRGGEDAEQRLEAAAAAMHMHRVEIWFITTAAARAEAAWLAGRTQDIAGIARPALRIQVDIGDRWRAGELAAWLYRCGIEIDVALPDLPAPYTLELDGRWREAADEWSRLGCPYDCALALAGGDQAALREALALFDGLGAVRAAQRVRWLLRERGVRSVPRGPQPRTRDDPLGLTGREREVYALVRQGLSNAVIAARLHRSERTIEHHVAAVLRKAGVATRIELIARAAAPPAIEHPRS
jgi:DNA-binding CsgD family transcriptional regulator